MLFGSLPPIYTTIKLWRDMATPGMAKVDLRLVRKSGMPLLALQRFCWFFLVPELYLLWGVIISVSFTSDLLGTLVFLALFFLLPGASIICSLRYGKSIPEFLTRSYLIYD